MSDCLFCKIKDGEIPSKKKYLKMKMYLLLKTSIHWAMYIFW